jgi:hypothetical protein
MGEWAVSTYNIVHGVDMGGGDPGDLPKWLHEVDCPQQDNGTDPTCGCVDRRRARINATRRTPEQLQDVAAALLTQALYEAVRISGAVERTRQRLVRDAGEHDAAAIARLMRTAKLTVTWDQP